MAFLGLSDCQGYDAWTVGERLIEHYRPIVMANPTTLALASSYNEGYGVSDETLMTVFKLAGIYRL